MFCMTDLPAGKPFWMLYAILFQVFGISPDISFISPDFMISGFFDPDK